jgi:hypothetical protein
MIEFGFLFYFLLNKMIFKDSSNGSFNKLGQPVEENGKQNND